MIEKTNSWCRKPKGWPSILEKCFVSAENQKEALRFKNIYKRLIVPTKPKGGHVGLPSTFARLQSFGPKKIRVLLDAKRQLEITSP